MGVQVNSNPFCLNESVEGWQEVNNDIANVIKAQSNLVNRGKVDIVDAVKEIGAVIRKYEPWGATNTKTRRIVVSLFHDEVKWA